MLREGCGGLAEYGKRERQLCKSTDGRSSVRGERVVRGGGGGRTSKPERLVQLLSIYRLAVENKTCSMPSAGTSQKNVGETDAARLSITRLIRHLSMSYGGVITVKIQKKQMQVLQSQRCSSREPPPRNAWV